MSWVAGVDGCRAGWFVVLRHVGSGEMRWRTAPDFPLILALPEQPEVICVDMIIGLPDVPEPGGRACDRAARRVLGHPRGSSVFSPPSRRALACDRYADALAVNRSISPGARGIAVQCFHLFPKIRDVDRCVTPGVQERVCEAHPELAFYEANDGVPVSHSKRAPEGQQERTNLLIRLGYRDVRAWIETIPRKAAGVADVLDAGIVCWTAERLLRGRATRVPDVPPRDVRGLRMEIWR